MGTSYADDGYTLYKLAPIGIQIIFNKVLAEEMKRYLTLRIANRLYDMNITDVDVGSMNDNSTVAQGVMDILATQEDRVRNLGMMPQFEFNA